MIRVDFTLYLLCEVITMSNETMYSSSEHRWWNDSHRALTGFLRKNWVRNPRQLRDIVMNCDVSPYVGALPPQLRARVPADEIEYVTAKFRDVLEDFLIANAPEIRSMKADKIYDIPEITNLFGTKCQLETKGATYVGLSPWEGGVGFVSKLSFPEINAHYALKLFKPFAEDEMEHGPWFEIATALAANRAEPHQNAPMYMAALRYEKYMLSQWLDSNKRAPYDKKYKIFKTSTDENGLRNWIGGRRIDFGETYKTDYGKLSYRGRKIYRTIMYGDDVRVEKIKSAMRTNFDKRDFSQAQMLAQEYKAAQQMLAYVDWRNFCGLNR